MFAFLDLTGVLTNEAAPLLKKYGVTEIYARENIRTCLEKLDLGPEKVMRYLDPTPLPGALETLEVIRRKGLEPVVITDNPLLDLENVNSAFRKILGCEIVSTCRIRWTGKNYVLLERAEKDEIARSYGPGALAVIDGENDLPLAEYVSGPVIVIGNEVDGDYRVGSISEVPDLLEKIL